LKRAYFVSISVGFVIAYLLFIALSFFYYPYSGQTFLKLLLVVGLLYLIPVLSNLAFFLIKDGKMIFFYLPILITILIEGILSVLFFVNLNLNNPEDNDQFYKLPVSIIISQIIIGMIVKRAIERKGMEQF